MQVAAEACVNGSFAFLVQMSGLDQPQISGAEVISFVSACCPAMQKNIVTFL